VPIDLEPNADGVFPETQVSLNGTHVFVVHDITLERRYHDDTPVQNATYKVKLASGHEIEGTLDAQGKAKLMGVSRSVTVVFGPDSREYERADTRDNPDFRGPVSDSAALFAKYESKS